MEIVEIILLTSLVVLAIVTVNSKKLRRSIVYIGVFSLLSSFAYLIYNAPDVAIAEAVIGCTISVIIMLVALRKYKIITIYYVKEENEIEGEKCLEMIRDLEDLLSRNEFEPQLIKTSFDDPTLHSDKEKFDLLFVDSGKKIFVYSASDNYHTPMIKKHLFDYKLGDIELDFISMQDVIDYE